MISGRVTSMGRKQSTFWRLSAFQNKDLFLFLMLFLSGCAGIRPPRGAEPYYMLIETTAYCPCGKCCGWKRSWKPPFAPVVSFGPNKGQKKEVGVTASGSTARKGTIAADLRFYPFGTVMDVPGYCTGRVEDVGGTIKGPARIDLFFKNPQAGTGMGPQAPQCPDMEVVV